MNKPSPVLAMAFAEDAMALASWTRRAAMTSGCGGMGPPTASATPACANANAALGRHEKSPRERAPFHKHKRVGYTPEDTK